MAHKRFGNLKTSYYHDIQTFQVSFQLLFCSFLALCWVCFLFLMNGTDNNDNLRAMGSFILDTLSWQM